MLSKLRKVEKSPEELKTDNNEQENNDKNLLLDTQNKEVGENLVEQLSSRKGNIPRKRPSVHERKVSQFNSENLNYNSESNIEIASLKDPVMNKEKDKSLYELIEYL